MTQRERPFGWLRGQTPRRKEKGAARSPQSSQLSLPRRIVAASYLRDRETRIKNAMMMTSRYPKHRSGDTVVKRKHFDR